MNILLHLEASLVKVRRAINSKRPRVEKSRAKSPTRLFHMQLRGALFSNIYVIYTFSEQTVKFECNDSTFGSAISLLVKVGNHHWYITKVQEK